MDSRSIPDAAPQAQGTGDHVVAVENIVKRFPGTIAIRDVSFAIHYGSIHALVGENGAGKSTLIKMLSGLYVPDAGRILIDGSPTDITSPHRAQEVGITTVHQERSLVSTLSGLDNIFLGREVLKGTWGGSLRPVSRNRMLEQVHDLCHEFDLNPNLLKRSVSELGAFARQIVEIIKALAFRSKLIIMDEPTGGLAEHERKVLFQQMRRLKERGTSVLWVTHQLEELTGLADRVTVLRDGALVATHEMADVTPTMVVKMMVGRDVESIETMVRQDAGSHSVSSSSPETLRVAGLSVGNELRNINLTVRKGEVVGVGGLAGSGANELVEALMGALPRKDGSIFVLGHKVNILNTEDAFRSGIAYVPNERKLQGIIPDFSIAENISSAALSRFCRLGFVSRRKEQANATQFVQRLRIKANNVHQRIALLSGGNQQKAIVARALTTKPALVIFNEPTEGVDVGAKTEIYKLIDEFIKAGGAAIVKSSELMELLGLSDRVIVMRNGCVAGELPGYKGGDDAGAPHALQEKFMSLALATQG